jgi:hypothetical protein
VVITGGKYGTVSSTLLSLPDKVQHSVYQYAPGPPSDHSYDDLSALLRQVLSAGKNRPKERDKAQESKGKKPSSKRKKKGKSKK